MLAAIVGIAAFGFVSFEVLAENRGVIAEVRSETDRAKLLAACNAGMAAAIAGLADKDMTQRWAIDSRPRTIVFDGVQLTITVEDERGKIPLNGINEEQERRMFELVGVTGNRLNTIVDSLEDWQDSDSDKRPSGSEAPAYADLGYKPRNSALHTVGELRMVKGMDDATFALVAPSLTVFFGESGSFSDETAQIFALRVLSEVDENSPEILDRQRELAGQKPPFDLTKGTQSLIGRTLTVRVEARQGDAYLKRSGIVQLTGYAPSPYWLRYLD